MNFESDLVHRSSPIRVQVMVDLGGLSWTWVDFRWSSCVRSPLIVQSNSILCGPQLAGFVVCAFLRPICVSRVGLRFSFCDCSFYRRRGWQVEKLVDFLRKFAAMI